MEHFLIMWAPPMIVLLSLALLFMWGGRRSSENQLVDQPNEHKTAQSPRP